MIGRRTLLLSRAFHILALCDCKTQLATESTKLGRDRAGRACQTTVMTRMIFNRYDDNLACLPPVQPAGPTSRFSMPQVLLAALLSRTGGSPCCLANAQASVQVTVQVQSKSQSKSASTISPGGTELELGFSGDHYYGCNCMAESR